MKQLARLIKRQVGRILELLRLQRHFVDEIGVLLHALFVPCIEQIIVLLMEPDIVVLLFFQVVEEKLFEILDEIRNRSSFVMGRVDRVAKILNIMEAFLLVRLQLLEILDDRRVFRHVVEFRIRLPILRNRRGGGFERGSRLGVVPFESVDIRLNRGGGGGRLLDVGGVHDRERRQRDEKRDDDQHERRHGEPLAPSLRVQRVRGAAIVLLHVRRNRDAGVVCGDFGGLPKIVELVDVGRRAQQRGAKRFCLALRVMTKRLRAFQL